MWQKQAGRKLQPYLVREIGTIRDTPKSAPGVVALRLQKSRLAIRRFTVRLELIVVG
jgi:hypothetical protein